MQHLTFGMRVLETFNVFPDGTHEENVQSQTANQNAIIDTDFFFNCYTFGNGVESSKIRIL